MTHRARYQALNPRGQGRLHLLTVALAWIVLLLEAHNAWRTHQNAGIIQVGPMPTAVEDDETALSVLSWGVLSPTLAVLSQMRVGHRGGV